jgi:cobalt/nickel transport system permease protein
VRLIDRNAQTNRWRRIPAGDKAAFALGMMMVSLCTPGWLVQGIIIIVMWACLLAGARIPLRDAVSCAAIPLGFIAASSLAQIVGLHFDQGGVAVSLSSAALEPAARVALRSFACVSALLGLALTTPLTDILQLLRRLGLGHEISDIALMMFVMGMTVFMFHCGVAVFVAVRFTQMQINAPRHQRAGDEQRRRERSGK